MWKDWLYSLSEKFLGIQEYKGKIFKLGTSSQEHFPTKIWDSREISQSSIQLKGDVVGLLIRKF
jgi:hypothetical protein